MCKSNDYIEPQNKRVHLSIRCWSNSVFVWKYCSKNHKSCRNIWPYFIRRSKLFPRSLQLFGNSCSNSSISVVSGHVNGWLQCLQQQVVEAILGMFYRARIACQYLVKSWDILYNFGYWLVWFFTEKTPDIVQQFFGSSLLWIICHNFLLFLLLLTWAA